MSFENALTAISSVGFPIVMCLILFWYMREVNTKHTEEVAGMTEAINKNTQVIEKLCAKMEVDTNA